MSDDGVKQGERTASRRVLWEPAIYEHKAALIGESPAAVSRSAALLCDSLVAEYDAYRADFLTVGIDVYNVEAEAVGAQLRPAGPTECPEIASPLWTLDDESARNAVPHSLEPPAIPGSGRFATLLDAAERAREAIAARPSTEVIESEGPPALRVAASGPVSIAAKLVGTEPLLIGAITGEDAALRVLEFATRIATAWLSAIRARGLEAVVFDSSASPPMFGPELYRRIVLPLHTRLMSVLAETGQTVRPLILGGNTVPVVRLLIAAGATQIVCDYAADATEFAEALGANVRHEAGARAQGDSSSALPLVRRNVDPTRIAASPAEAAATLARDLTRLPGAIAGTGILPYAFDPDRVREFRRACLEEARYRNERSEM